MRRLVFARPSRSAGRRRLQYLLPLLLLLGLLAGLTGTGTGTTVVPATKAAHSGPADGFRSGPPLPRPRKAAGAPAGQAPADKTLGRLIGQYQKEQRRQGEENFHLSRNRDNLLQARTALADVQAQARSAHQPVDTRVEKVLQGAVNDAQRAVANNQRTIDASQQRLVALGRQIDKRITKLRKSGDNQAQITIATGLVANANVMAEARQEAKKATTAAIGQAALSKAPVTVQGALRLKRIPKGLITATSRRLDFSAGVRRWTSPANGVPYALFNLTKKSTSVETGRNASRLNYSQAPQQWNAAVPDRIPLFRMGGFGIGLIPKFSANLQDATGVKAESNDQKTRFVGIPLKLGHPPIVGSRGARGKVSLGKQNKDTLKVDFAVEGGIWDRGSGQEFPLPVNAGGKISAEVGVVWPPDWSVSRPTATLELNPTIEMVVNQDYSPRTIVNWINRGLARAGLPPISTGTPIPNVHINTSTEAAAVLALGKYKVKVPVGLALRLGFKPPHQAAAPARLIQLARNYGGSAVEQITPGTARTKEIAVTKKTGSTRAYAVYAPKATDATKIVAGATRKVAKRSPNSATGLLIDLSKAPDQVQKQVADQLRGQADTPRWNGVSVYVAGPHGPPQPVLDHGQAPTLGTRPWVKPTVKERPRPNALPAAPTAQAQPGQDKPRPGRKQNPDTGDGQAKSSPMSIPCPHGPDLANGGCLPPTCSDVMNTQDIGRCVTPPAPVVTCGDVRTTGTRCVPPTKPPVPCSDAMNTQDIGTCVRTPEPRPVCGDVMNAADVGRCVPPVEPVLLCSHVVVQGQKCLPPRKPAEPGTQVYKARPQPQANVQPQTQAQAQAQAQAQTNVQVQGQPQVQTEGGRQYGPRGQGQFQPRVQAQPQVQDQPQRRPEPTVTAEPVARTGTTAPPAVRTTPVKTLVKAAPVAATPVTTPVRKPPAKTAPVKSAVVTAPVTVTPVETAPVKATPVKATPLKATPVKTTPVTATQAAELATSLGISPSTLSTTQTSPTKASPTTKTPSTTLKLPPSSLATTLSPAASAKAPTTSPASTGSIIKLPATALVPAA